VDYNLFQINSKNIDEFIHLYRDPWRTEKSYDLIHDAYDNSQIAIRHLADLHGQFGDWGKALAAYNSGAGRVRRNEVPLETQHYVQRIAPYSWWMAYKENLISLD